MFDSCKYISIRTWRVKEVQWLVILSTKFPWDRKFLGKWCWYFRDLSEFVVELEIFILVSVNQTYWILSACSVGKHMCTLLPTCSQMDLILVLSAVVIVDKVGCTYQVLLKFHQIYDKYSSAVTNHKKDMNPAWNSLQTFHLGPSRRIYEMSVIRIWRKLTMLKWHCTLLCGWF